MPRHLSVAPEIEIYRTLTPHSVEYDYTGVKKAITDLARRRQLVEPFTDVFVLLNSPRVHLLPRSELEKAAHTSFYRKLGARAVAEHLEDALQDHPTHIETLAVQPQDVHFVDHGNSIEAGFIINEATVWDEQQTVIDTLSSLTYTSLQHPRPMITFAHLFQSYSTYIVETGANEAAPASFILRGVQVDNLT